MIFQRNKHIKSVFELMKNFQNKNNIFKNMFSLKKSNIFINKYHHILYFITI